MDKSDPLVKMWRDRLAHNVKAFRKVRGRGPDLLVMAACKRGIAQAVKANLRPPYIH